MQIKKILLALVVMISIILAACTLTTPAATPPTAALNGTSWTLVSLNTQPSAPVTQITLNFDNGMIAGTDGCNSYSTSYTVNGDKINVDKNIVTTLMACPDPIMQQAAIYTAMLSKAATYKIEGQQLTLFDLGGKTLATFTRAGTAVTSPTQTPQNDASFTQALPNAAYPVEGTSTGKAQLKDGVFEEPAAPGSATKIRVHLGKEQAFGDLNGDGIHDAAVTLVVDPGGSGTFTYLAVVINDNGTAKPVASVLLGDRISMKSVSIQNGEVVATILTRKPDEPMSAEPTVEVTRTFKLQGDQLVEIK